MDFCVVVKVSRRSVSFWYQTEGKRYAPLLMKGSNEVPLYFYVEDNQFDFGSNARDRFYRNDPNAYGDYFELVKDPGRHFVLYNSSKRVKQLLYYGIEQFLSHFLNTVIYKSDSIESYRRTFPLKFIFAADLGEPECDLVADMFREAGYRTICVLNYNQILLEHLRASNFLGRDQAALMLTGTDDTLYVELYVKGSAGAVSGTAIAGQGADPRIRILAELIVDYIRDQNPYLDLDAGREVSALLAYCAGLLTEGRMILTGDAELTSGSKFWFRINLKSVEDRLQYYSGDLIVSTLISDLLQSFGIRQEELMVLLCSDQIRTSYFSRRLLGQYPHVEAIMPVQTDEAMQLVFTKGLQTTGTGPEVTPRVLPPPLPPKKAVVPSPVLKPPLPMAKPVVTSVQKPPLPAVKPSVSTGRAAITPPPMPPPKKKT